MNSPSSKNNSIPKDIISQIRLPQISQYDLVSIVKPSKIVTTEAYMEAMEYHVIPTQFDKNQKQFQQRRKHEVSHHDKKGILYYLGTNQGTSAWNNPHDSGLVTCSASSVGLGHVRDLVGDANASDFLTSNVSSSWVQIKLNNNYEAIPNRYTFSYYTGGGSNKPQNWILEGCTKDGSWIKLSTHVRDTSFGQESIPWNSPVSWPILSCSCPVNAFRITQTDKTSSGENYLIMKGFEVYGTLNQRNF